MSSGARCGECGAVIATDGPGGFCARCLLGLGLEHAEPGGGAKATAQNPNVSERAATTEPAGDQIGPYRLLQEIGHGGCGVVYLAEQETPVRRKVALKVIKLGMDTRQVVARFEAERQALALMDHPNIAKVLDGGAVGTSGEALVSPISNSRSEVHYGRPYFVMELVDGLKLTDYCDQHRLSTRQRLELFVQVCHAVQHAHQKGIIHRDLKPSNVLVAAHDGRAVPKVIDFGIAKATQGRLTDETFFTALEQFLGTPAYMSPEQTELGGLDIDTRSDIYSLGVLLYELLAGKTPFEAKELLGAGLEGMRRRIREQEPPKPSTRISTLAAPEQTTVAQCRQVETLKLVRLVRGDLDWIVMKCLEKDRARRYETANGLARDIERHLSNEPVLACPPSRVYQLQKWIRRNQALFGTVTAIVTILLFGVTVSTTQAVRATVAERQQKHLHQLAQEARANEARQHAQARTEAAKSKQVAQFLEQMLKSVGPSVALGRDTTMLREILEKTAERVGRELANQPEVELHLRRTLADAYEELGLYTEMESMARECLDLSLARYNEEDLNVAWALDRLGIAQWHLRNLAAAEDLIGQALTMRQKLLGDENPVVAGSLNNLGLCHWHRFELREAEAMLRRSLELKWKLLGHENLATATALDNLANVLQTLEKKGGEVTALYCEALELRRKLVGARHPIVAESLSGLGTALMGEGNLEEAESVSREALEMTRELLGNDHPALASALNNVAGVLQHRGKLAEAEALAREGLALRQKQKPREKSELAGSLSVLALVLESRKKFPEAEANYRQALDLWKNLFGNEHPKVGSCLADLGIVLHKQGKLAEAETVAGEALRLARKFHGDEHPFVATAIENVADVIRDRGRLAESELLRRQALAMRRNLFGNEDPSVAQALNDLGDVLHRQGKLAEAEALCREGLAIRRKIFGNEHPYVALSIKNLGAVLERQGKLAEAEPFFREALTLRLKLLGPAHPDVTSAFDSLLSVLEQQGKLEDMAKLGRDHLPGLRAALKSDDPDLARALSQFTSILLLAQKFTEAEVVARECLDICEKRLPDNWHTFDARTLLGAALLGQKRYELAEPLLLSGYEGMKQRESKMSERSKPLLKEPVKRLVTLYQQTNRPDRAADWNNQLAELDRITTATQPTVASPPSRPD